MRYKISSKVFQIAFIISSIFLIILYFHPFNIHNRRSPATRSNANSRVFGESSKFLRS